MVAPVVIGVFWGIVKIVTLAATAYEIYDTVRSISEEIDDFDNDLEAAKLVLLKHIQILLEEINKKIDKATEVALLHALAKYDVKIQSQTTKQALGRTGTDADRTKIIAAIKQNIPFRKFISAVCEQANKTPKISLRRPKGSEIKLKDLPHAKRAALLKLLSMTAEQLELTDEIDKLIVVRLKQLVANFLFEFQDRELDWASPLKAEACFGPPQLFDDPPIEAGTRTKLHRVGSPINPFYPYPISKHGIISADLAIPDYRKDPLTKKNLFAVIEIKFPGDSIEKNNLTNMTYWQSRRVLPRPA